MAVAFRAASNKSSTVGTASSLATNKIGQVGDLVVAIVDVENQGAVITAGDSGWTRLWLDNSNAYPIYTNSEACFVKFVTSSDPAAWTFNSSVAGWISINLVAFSAAAALPTATAWATVDFVTKHDNNPAVECPRVTAAAGDMVLYHGFTDAGDANAWNTTPANYSATLAVVSVGTSSAECYYAISAAGLSPAGQWYEGGFSDTRWPGARTLLIPANAAPNAPTLTSPANASYVNLAAGATFTGTPSDPNPGDSMSAYAMRRKISGAGAYEYWNATTGAWQSTIKWNTAAAPLSVTFGAGKWTNGNVYNWSFATADSAGAQGSFAPDFTVTAQTPPSATVDTPTGEITTSTPTVAWTDTLPSGATQTSYRVVVETGDVDVIPGAGEAVWDSGVVNSADTAVAVPESNFLTADRTYRFFVQITETGGLTGAWSYSDATVALAAPSTPTVVAIAVNPSARIDVTVTAGGGDPVPTYFVVERSQDGGATWQAVRQGEQIPYAPVVNLSDYEAQPSVPAMYRARAVVSTTGNFVPSDNSEVSSATIAISKYWLKDPLDPTRNRIVWVTDWPEIDYPVDAAVHEPLSKSSDTETETTPTVVYGARRSGRMTVTFQCVDLADRTSLRGLIESRRVLLLQMPPEKAGDPASQWYVARVSDSRVKRLARAKIPHRTLDVDFVVVGAP